MLPENCGGNPISVSASDQHSCVVTDTGDLFTWGTSGGEGGALGHGSNRWQPLAKRVPSLKKVIHQGFSRQPDQKKTYLDEHATDCRGADQSSRVDDLCGKAQKISHSFYSCAVHEKLPSLSCQVARVAAAPDHTVVLLQASCPSLPHGAAFSTVDALPNEREDVGRSRIEDEGEDADSDIDDGDDEQNDDASHGGGLFTTNPAGGFEPLTLKQCCEAKLAREVDLHNAGAMLAYAVRRRLLF